MSVASTLSESAAAFAVRRRDLLARPGRPVAARRRELAALTDSWLGDTFSAAMASAGPPEHLGVALVAVGGFGRGELSPGSDLDLLLLHANRKDVAGLAEKIWYPVWDSGVQLDHSVRTLEEARRLAGKDLAVLLGLLDARVVAGDPGLVARLRSTVLADWRAAARGRLPALREVWEERGAKYGDLRHAIEPELKEGRGGLRDLVTLRAVAASWIADRPHRDVDDAVARLADVRDALHLVTGRGGNRLVQQEQDQVAARLELPDADVLLREVATCAAAVTHASDVTWRRALQSTQAQRSRYIRGRRPVLRLLGPGLAEHDGEAVLTAQADPTEDRLLLLRTAARAARAGLPLSPSSVDRLAADAPALPEPWPDGARDLFVELLGSGPALVPVWEALDQAGLIQRLLPEWSRVRNLPQRNAVHAFSVDRHLLETVVEARESVRDVARPDLLLWAALLHDIGKGTGGDHSVDGVPLAEAVCRRVGLAAADIDVVRRLVRHHLLLVETATRRDLADPSSSQTVADAVGRSDVLDLLLALTAADARATGPAVWTPWRAGLVDQLSDLVRGTLAGAPLPDQVPLTDHQLELVAGSTLAVELERTYDSSWTVTVAAVDQKGLFGAVAGVLALHRLSVRAAQASTVGDMTLDVWTVEPEMGGEPALEALRDDIRRALDGSLDLTRKLERRDSERRQRKGWSPPAARVDLVAAASGGATVIEVRAADTTALLHRLGRAIALMGVGIRAARVATIGAEAIDVFYLVGAARDGSEGGPLDEVSIREVLRVLRDAAG